ncbi:MAG: TetR/AcrR family transcriptional regulator [Anaerolineales bacterium]|nr:TetR/AcrR family transcriptional regulator [Anaerolineales bacterium]
MVDESLSRGERTRAEIIQAAHELFVRQGYHGTSMRQIAKKAGIALGGVYNHFESKQDVFREVFLAYHPYQEVLPVMLQAEGDTIEEIVRDAIGRMIAALQDRPKFMNLMFIEMVEFNSLHARELFETLMPQFVQILQRALQTDRERLRPIPPMMLLRAFFGLFFSYFLTEIIFSENAPPEFRQGAIDHLIDIFLHGVMKPDSDPGIEQAVVL